MRNVIIGISVLLLALMVIPLFGYAGVTITIPDDFSTIQQAIDAASNGDTVLVRDGTYLLTAALDFNGKAITVRSENGADSCFLDGQNTTRVVYFHSGEGSQSVLSGFTIRNGKAIHGAGIYIGTSSPTITECTISSNVVYNSGTWGDAYGGGIYIDWSSPTIRRCTIRGNHAQAPNSGYAEGAGIYMESASPIITDCFVGGNVALSGYSAQGGGFAVYNSQPTINNTIISKNSVSAPVYGQGGGLRFNSSSPKLVNCIISENSAEDGAGIMISQGVSISTFTNCTIVRNSASNHGGGLYSSNSNVQIYNGILWQNSADQVFFGVIAAPVINHSDVYGGYTGIGNINSPPLFVDMAQQNYHLTSASPCINAGSNAALYLPLQDIDGHDRISTGITDMGAYEYSTANTSDAIVYPQLAIGGGYAVTLLVQNNSTSAWTGRAAPLLRDGSLDYLITDLSLAAGETQKLVFSGGPNLTSTGLELFGTAGNTTSALSVAFFFTYSPNGIFEDSVGVPKGQAATKFTLPVEEAAPIATGIAVRRLPYITDSPITLTLRDAQGTQIGTIARSSDFALFVWQLFPGLPSDFIGSMTVESGTEFHMIAFRMDQTDGEPQFTTCPAEAR